MALGISTIVFVVTVSFCNIIVAFRNETDPFCNEKSDTVTT